MHSKEDHLNPADLQGALSKDTPAIEQSRRLVEAIDGLVEATDQMQKSFFFFIAATMAGSGTAHFVLPNVQDSPDAWGPTALPSQFADIPYAPFAKSDRLGRIADWNAPPDPRRDNRGRDNRQQGNHRQRAHLLPRRSDSEARPPTGSGEEGGGRRRGVPGRCGYRAKATASRLFWSSADQERERERERGTTVPTVPQLSCHPTVNPDDVNPFKIFRLFAAAGTRCHPGRAHRHHSQKGNQSLTSIHRSLAQTRRRMT
jgi:hypothetical protein